MLKFIDIARALKIPYHTVCHICTYKPVPTRKKKYGGQEWKLEQNHIDFLVSEETLQGYTEYYFLNINEYDRHTALWENDLDIIEVWE